MIKKILDIITTFAGSAVSVIAIAGKVLNILLDLAGRLIAAFDWKPAQEFVDFIEEHNIEGWLEKIAKALKNFKGSQE